MNKSYQNPIPESDLAESLKKEGYALQTWSNGPHFSYASHDHPYDKVIVVLAGSICFDTPGSESHELKVGDRLRLAAGTVHSAIAGPRGVTCLEGQKSKEKI